MRNVIYERALKTTPEFDELNTIQDLSAAQGLDERSAHNHNQGTTPCQNNVACSEWVPIIRAPFRVRIMLYVVNG